MNSAAASYQESSHFIHSRYEDTAHIIFNQQQKIRQDEKRKERQHTHAFPQNRLAVAFPYKESEVNRYGNRAVVATELDTQADKPKDKPKPTPRKTSNQPEPHTEKPKDKPKAAPRKTANQSETNSTEKPASKSNSPEVSPDKEPKQQESLLSSAYPTPTHPAIKSSQREATDYLHLRSRSLRTSSQQGSLQQSSIQRECSNSQRSSIQYSDSNRSSSHQSGSQRSSIQRRRSSKRITSIETSV